MAQVILTGIFGVFWTHIRSKCRFAFFPDTCVIYRGGGIYLWRRKGNRVYLANDVCIPSANGCHAAEPKVRAFGLDSPCPYYLYCHPL